MFKPTEILIFVNNILSACQCQGILHSVNDIAVNKEEKQ